VAAERISEEKRGETFGREQPNLNWKWTPWQLSQQIGFHFKPPTTLLSHNITIVIVIDQLLETNHHASIIQNMTPRLHRSQDLEGKVAVVTGASRGIGRAVAMNLASRGCAVLGTCSDPTNIPLIQSVSIEVELLASRLLRPPKVIGISANILSPTCAVTIADALVSHFNSKIDIFINNAADSRTGVLGELTVQEIQESMVSNIQTPVLIVDELVKRKMFRPESRIVYISSVRSRQPWSMQLMYAAGKSAGESLCRTWAQAFGGREENVSGFCGLFLVCLKRADNLIALEFLFL